MPSTDWGALLPTQVSEWINFDSTSPSWCYQENDNSMAAKQTEGVAGLWNTLANNNLALLADEVGMGKTFQALGVMALLWKMKPDAKVLVMAPNRDICKHWVREYHTFIRDHYRQTDHLVRNAVDGGAVHEPSMLWRLRDLVTSVESGTSHFYLTTIHALSGLVPTDKKSSNDLSAIARRNAKKMHRTIKNELGDDGFDLVVIDEAHYFRNKAGGSQRVAAAEGFFGSDDSRLGKKVLLMTATPSHSSPSNVRNILSYFTDLEGEQNPSDIETLLGSYAIRRLRHMQGLKKSHNKYNYRHEKAIPSSFEDNLDAELFFALYQKKLVEAKGEAGGNRRFLYGYLEGFESVGSSALENIRDDDQFGDDGSANSFNSAPDSQLLASLTKGFHNIYERFPDHPKYGALVKQCVPEDLFDGRVDLHDHKHLIFVRRIPSVREITQRINAEYDEILAKKIVYAWQLDHPVLILNQWRSLGWSRQFLNEFIKRNETLENDADPLINNDMFVDEETAEELELKLSSKISDLFVVKTIGEKRTDCTNVSLRFRRPESLFSLFLEPPSDYICAPYQYYFKKRIGQRDRDSYGDAAFDARLKCHDTFSRKSESEDQSECDEGNYRIPMYTAWGEMYEMLPDNIKTQLSSWKDRNPAILENLGNYLKSGYVFASPVMIEIYCWFTEFSLINSDQNAQQRYCDFVDWIKPRLQTSLMLRYFINAIETFEAMCEKITDHRLTDWESPWRELTNLQNPAWYASGETPNRQRLILGFNSPFYPNVLVATSVFQEGVNLHLQCQKVHHYGIAWTPGDNEQRVGRVDRLFGKVNQLLKLDDQAELRIHYPYLTKSFDQEQLASFMRLKHGVEDKIDACSFQNFNSEIDLKSASDGWEEYLRRPNYETITKDPYPAVFEGSRLPSKVYSPYKQAADIDLTGMIGARFQSLINQDKEKLHSVSSNEHHPNALLLIESIINNKNMVRNQPIVVECHYSSLFSSLVSGTVYYLVIKSPLASKAALESLDEAAVQRLIADFYNDTKEAPLVKLAMDDKRENSHFYLYTRVDLPFFVMDDNKGVLSDEELRMAYQQIKHSTDIFEFNLFEGRQDLEKKDLAVGKHTSAIKLDSKSNLSVGFSMLRKNWKIHNSVDGNIAYLSKNMTISKLMALGSLQGIKPNLSKDFLPLLLNHLLPMVHFQTNGNNYKCYMRYPSVDFQECEQILLERWFDYINK